MNTSKFRANYNFVTKFYRILTIAAVFLLLTNCENQKQDLYVMIDDQNGFIDDIHGWNFVTNTNDVSIGGIGNWHGTPVNRIIGADSYNNLGSNGINPAVNY